MAQITHAVFSSVLSVSVKDSYFEFEVKLQSGEVGSYVDEAVKIATLTY